MKTLILLAGLSAVTLAAWTGLWLFGGGVPVEVAVVGEEAIQEYVDEQAKTRLPRTHTITMPYSGRVDEITHKEGQEVKKGEVVARLVKKDLDLELAAAQAAVDRLEAAIKESTHLAVEWTAKRQADKYVESMQHTVQAAEERKVAGAERFKVASDVFERLRNLTSNNRTGGVITQEQLDESRLRMVESDTSFQQDKLVHRALLAVQAATNLLPQMVLDYIGKKSLETAKLQREREQAQAQLDQVKLKIQRRELKSPVEGVVMQRPVQNEQYLAAGTTLLEIGDLSEMEIEADILSQDVVKVKAGDAVQISGPAIGHKAVGGTVRRVFPSGFTKVSSLGVEQQRVRVIIGFNEGVLAALRADRRLGVGYRVNVRIITAEKPNAVVIPRSALVRSAEGTWQVFAVRNGRAVRCDDIVVGTPNGLMNDEKVEVVEGLKVGEKVILASEASLRSGDRVTAK